MKDKQALGTATGRLVFFLGGRDLEMLTVRELLEEPGLRFHDKSLAWGAKASDYREEIDNALSAGLTPVLVELGVDIPLPADRVTVIDHHGRRAGSDLPTSLHQVFDLLQLPGERWSRRFELVAANDRGYIPEMLERGATPQEIEEIRAADRRVQGVTEEEEAVATAAIAQRREYAQGMLTVVVLSHNRASIVADLLLAELGGPGYENLLVISPEEVNFFGDGDSVRMLDKLFPGGWLGGALPERGFWGRRGACKDVERLLVKHLEARQYKIAENTGDSYEGRAGNGEE